MKKADLERLALEIREEFGLGKIDRFDPFAAATEYGVRVVGGSELPESIAGFGYFREGPRARLSALLTRQNGTTFIVEDDTHPPHRRRSNVSHEMAHVFLDHLDVTQLCTVEAGATRSKSPLEVDATELGARLLLPDDAAKYWAARGWSPDGLVDQFDVSRQLAEWRWRMSGASKIALKRRR